MHNDSKVCTTMVNIDRFGEYCIFPVQEKNQNKTKTKPQTPRVQNFFDEIELSVLSGMNTVRDFGKRTAAELKCAEVYRAR